jgi:hypothetical protein
LLSERRYEYTSESKLAAVKSLVMVRIMERATTAAVEILIESKAVNGGRCAFVEMLLANE